MQGLLRRTGLLDLHILVGGSNQGGSSLPTNFFSSLRPTCCCIVALPNGQKEHPVLQCHGASFFYAVRDLLSVSHS